MHHIEISFRDDYFICKLEVWPEQLRVEIYQAGTDVHCVAEQSFPRGYIRADVVKLLKKYIPNINDDYFILLIDSLHPFNPIKK